MENRIKGSKLQVTANHARRTYTIRRTFKGVTLIKYRTNIMSKEEFEEHLYNTSGDWENFLRTNYNYYKI